MPTLNARLKILDIQDGNIEFKDNCVFYDQYKGKKSKFIEGKLSYTPTACAKCQAPNENYSLYRNGTQLTRITLSMAGVHPTYLLLKKQRFMCKSCKTTLQLKLLWSKTIVLLPILSKDLSYSKKQTLNQEYC